MIDFALNGFRHDTGLVLGVRGKSWTRKMGEKSGGDLRGLLGWVGLRGGLSGLISFIRLEMKLQGRSVGRVDE